jgi:hypothetical protein
MAGDIGWYDATLSYDAEKGRISTVINSYYTAGESGSGIQYMAPWYITMSARVLRNGTQIKLWDFNNTSSRWYGNLNVDHFDVQIGDELEIKSSKYNQNSGTGALGTNRNDLRILRVINNITGEENSSDFTSETTVFVVTEYGLFKKGTSQSQQQEVYVSDFNSFFSEAKASVPQEKWSDVDAYKNLKTGLIYGSNLLPDEEKEKFLEEFYALINSEPEPIVPIREKPKHNKNGGIKWISGNIVSDKAVFEVYLPDGKKADEVRAVIYDKVGNVVFETTAQRNEKMVWDLRNSASRNVANGIYLIAVEAKGAKITHTYTTKVGVKR